MGQQFYQQGQALRVGKTNPSQTMQGLDLPRYLPPRGPDWARSFAWWMLRRYGWDIRGHYPDAARFIIIGAPHSSNFDWYWGMFVQWALGVRFSYMIKKTFFFPPISWILRWMGGVPVDRSRAKGLIGAAVEQFAETDRLVLLITPEGRTKPVRRVKRGFYEIARAADVPVLVVSFRYDEKVIALDGYLDVSGTFEDVEARLDAHYGPIRGRHRGYLDRLENWGHKPLDKNTKILD